MSWIKDYCEQTGFILDEAQAEGLTKLHASCDPPCPRVLAAHGFLERWRSRPARN
ncbi:hypothetical protein IU414_06705 [Nocardia farcinica]|uniref:hypothetical protein n=1 Tax=Nocardia farcinica TaxID=37329 RepID=UPI001894A9B9|nr:hypothetical protein [Nocardia farcinica]MBF6584449.1 hypothetical protein [Nocardia farcinica]